MVKDLYGEDSGTESRLGSADTRGIGGIGNRERCAIRIRCGSAGLSDDGGASTIIEINHRHTEAEISKAAARDRKVCRWRSQIDGIRCDGADSGWWTRIIDGERGAAEKNPLGRPCVGVLVINFYSDCSCP